MYVTFMPNTKRRNSQNGTKYNKNGTGGMKWNWAEQMEQANWGGTGGLRRDRRDAMER